jgi:hypothetical protein
MRYAWGAVPKPILPASSTNNTWDANRRNRSTDDNSDLYANHLVNRSFQHCLPCTPDEQHLCNFGRRAARPASLLLPGFFIAQETAQFFIQGHDKKLGSTGNPASGQRIRFTFRMYLLDQTRSRNLIVKRTEQILN